MAGVNAGVNVKLTADVGSFKKDIQSATSTVKTLDAQLKANESQLKATGDAEVYMSNKVGLLKQQLNAQKQVVAATNDALQAMKNRGVSPASSEFQKMEKNLANATGKMFEIQAQIKEVESGSAGAKKETDGMNEALKKIGKGVGFSNVTQGLKDITDRLESAGRAAVNMGKKIAKSAMDSTGWADDILTRAVQNSTDAETIQRMDNVAQFIDTDVDTIMAARSRLAKNSGKVEELFGLQTGGMSLEDQFWAVGEAIQGMTDDIEREQAAQEVFGRGWKELVPLFATGREEYNRLMGEQNVLTNEQVQKLGEADDKFQEMQIELQRLKNEFWAENADTIIDLLQWLIDNKDAVKTALTVIAGGFAMLKMGELALNVKKVVDGFGLIKSMGGKGGSPTVPTGGTGGGGGAAKTGFLSKAGAWMADGLGVSMAGAGGGLALIAGGTILAGKIVSDLNDAATKAREVSTNVNRFSSIGGGSGINNIPRELSNAMNGVMKDKRLVLQETVRALLGMSGNSSNAAYQMKWLAYNLGSDMFDAFNYPNTSGEDRNKLIDMLGMSGDYTPAAAAMMLRAAGVDVNDRRLTGSQSQAYQSALYYLDSHEGYMTKNGGFTEGLGIINDFFLKSGTFNENGEWSIPGLEETSEKVAGFGTTITDTGDNVELLGEEAYTASQHVSKMGELSGGAEHDVQALGAAAAAAAGVLLSIQAPNWAPHANGLPYVPYDGYLAMLHKGERVVPAREIAGRSFSSNLYVENMNMGGGMDADALAAAIAGRNRRMMAGYGS